MIGSRAPSAVAARATAGATARGRGQRWMQLAFFGLLLAIMPLALSGRYHLNLMIFIGLNTLVVVGLNLLMGYAGQISLGHNAFLGIGAYTYGILGATWGVNPWLALGAAVALAVMIAFLVGLPTLKLTGYYLAMATLGFGIIVHICLREWAWLTGGPSGLVNIPPLSVAGESLNTPLRTYYLVWGLVLLGLISSLNIVDSRVGRALRAIHDSEIAARASGVATARLKVAVFVLSAFWAALAGALYAHFVSFVSPSSFDFMVAVKLVTMVVIGGMASVWGAVFGAAALTLLPELLAVVHDYDIIIYGLVLMVVMIFMPQGLTRGVVDLVEKRRRRRARGQLHE